MFEIQHLAQPVSAMGMDPARFETWDYIAPQVLNVHPFGLIKLHPIEMYFPLMAERSAVEHADYLIALTVAW